MTKQAGVNSQTEKSEPDFREEISHIVDNYDAIDIKQNSSRSDNQHDILDDFDGLL